MGSFALRRWIFAENPRATEGRPYGCAGIAWGKQTHNLPDLSFRGSEATVGISW